MKISINRANKIRVALEETKPSFEKTVALRTDEDITESLVVFAKAETALELSFFDHVQTQNKIGEIRSLIHQANIVNGILPLIAKIATLENTIRVHKEVLDMTGKVQYGLKPPTSMDDFTSAVKHRSAVVAVDVTKAPAGQAMQVDCFQAFREVVAKHLRAYKLELQNLQEERNHKNHVCVLELPPGLVEFLNTRSLLSVQAVAA